MEKRRFLGSVQPRPRKRDHPLRREHGRVHRNDRRQMDLCDRPEQDRLVHPPHRRRHDAGDSDSGKHREQGALRRSPVHLGLGPHAGRGVHHHAGTRTCAARSAESRPARRCLPRRRHGRGRIAAQERGALLPRHGADLLLPRRLQAHRDQLHAHPGAGFPQGFLLPGGLLHERDVQAGSGRRPHAGGRPAFEPQRRHEGVQALLGA